MGASGTLDSVEALRRFHIGNDVVSLGENSSAFHKLIKVTGAEGKVEKIGEILNSYKDKGALIFAHEDELFNTLSGKLISEATKEVKLSVYKYWNENEGKGEYKYKIID